VIEDVVGVDQVAHQVGRGGAAHASEGNRTCGAGATVTTLAEVDTGLRGAWCGFGR
jgi:hypothetical protein